MTSHVDQVTYRCGQCGGDCYQRASRRGPVLCGACGARMRRCGPPPPPGPDEPAIVAAEAQNVSRGWL
jgi:hypothetical protein